VIVYNAINKGQFPLFLS